MVNADFRQADTVNHGDRDTFLSNTRHRNERESVRERRPEETRVESIGRVDGSSRIPVEIEEAA